MERGVPDPGELRLLRPSSWEMASRLSYLFSGTMPDPELMAAAERNGLGTAAEVAAQAQRLVMTAQTARTMESFLRQWLQFDKVQHPIKEGSPGPWDPDNSGTMLREELRLFANDVFWNSDDSIKTLFTASHSILSGRMSGIYGVKLAGEAWTKVTLDPARRAGLLTRAGMMAGLAHNNQTSPTFRGQFVRQQLLCQTPPPPPPEADTAIPLPSSTATTRERLSAHVKSPVCAACHRFMDLIGFGFENYDWIGFWRDRESGKPIDASGELVGTDVDGPFTGAVELQQRLASSRQVRGCMARQWFRYAMGRQESGGDAAALAQIEQALEASGGNLRRFLPPLTQTDAFLFLGCPDGRCPQVRR